LNTVVSDFGLLSILAFGCAQLVCLFFLHACTFIYVYCVWVLLFLHGTLSSFKCLSPVCHIKAIILRFDLVGFGSIDFNQCSSVVNGSFNFVGKAVTTSCVDYFSFSFFLPFISPLFPVCLPLDCIPTYLLTCSHPALSTYCLTCCACISLLFSSPLPALLCMHHLAIYLCIIAPMVRVSVPPLPLYHHALYAHHLVFKSLVQSSF
jgi:hypothetical protein